MINLIPPAGHKAIRHEYYFRVASTISFLFTGVFIFLTVALIPTYVLVEAQIDVFKAIAIKENGENKMFKNTDAEVIFTKEMIIQFKRVSDNMYASAAIVEIKEISPESIVFSNFIVEAPNGVTDKIQIQGKSPTRESLAQLKNILEASEMFEKAEVPISDLARGTDVPFAITVTLTKK